MTDKATWTRLIERAIENGWPQKSNATKYKISDIQTEEDLYQGRLGITGITTYSTGKKDYDFYFYSLPDLICDPDFMQAVCGDMEVCKICGKLRMSRDEKVIKHCLCLCSKTLYGEYKKHMSAYQHAQQQLIILSPDERIEYFKRFLEE